MKTVSSPWGESGCSEGMRLEFPARPEYVSVVRLALSGVCNLLQMPYDVLEDVKLAVAEACTNAIRHAYSGKDLAKARVSIRCYVGTEGLEVLVEDQGRGFDPDRVPKFNVERLTLKGEHLGVGLEMMRALMDRVEIHSGASGTVVHLVRSLDRQV